MADQEALRQYTNSITQFYEATGVRMVYNTIPTSAKTPALQALPPAVLFTPMKQIQDLMLVQGAPPACTNCGTVMNPGCELYRDANQYKCSVCGARNAMPASLPVGEDGLPVYYTHKAIELQLEPTIRAAVPAPVFIFVVDVACPARELERQKTLIMNATADLPDGAYVGLITYGASVAVHEVLYDVYPRAHVFRGQRVAYDTIAQLLNVRGLLNRGLNAADARPSAQTLVHQKFIRSWADCALHFQQIVQDLETDATPAPGYRAIRYTGAALDAAAGLVAGFQNSQMTFGSVRVELFAGGPCTHGAGAVADWELATPMRSSDALIHKDASTNHVDAALEFYSALGKKFAGVRAVVDVINGSLDQTGILEMRPLISMLGGETFIGEDFTDDHVMTSVTTHMAAATAELRNEAPFVFASTTTISITTPANIRIAGCMGPGHSVTLSQHSQNPTTNAEYRPSMPTKDQIGQGGTNRWTLSSMSPRTTFCFVIQPIVLPAGASAGNLSPDYAVIQVRAQYTTPCGQHRMRIVTLRARSVPETPEHIVRGFDASAAACLMARMHAHQFFRAPFIDPHIPRARVDTNLMDVLRAMVPRDAGLGGATALESVIPLAVRPLIPLIYHFRRSPFMTWGSTSPDEATYFRLQLMTDSPDMMIRMLAPEMFVYKFGQPPVPASLDARNLTADSLVLFDSFFRVVLWSGTTVAAWRKMAEEGDPAYAEVGKWLSMINDEVKVFVERLHFPVPALVRCDSGKSAERWIKARINPSNRQTRDSVAVANIGDGVVSTEDLPLEDFKRRILETLAQK